GSAQVSKRDASGTDRYLYAMPAVVRVAERIPTRQRRLGEAVLVMRAHLECVLAWIDADDDGVPVRETVRRVGRRHRRRPPRLAVDAHLHARDTMTAPRNA